MTRARNIAGFSTITTTPSPVHVGPIGVLTATRIDGEFNQVDLATRNITAAGIAATNLQVSGITTGLNVSGIITAQNGINFNGTSTGLNVSGIATFSGGVSIGGTLTYEDVTNVDSVGIVTAREGIFIPDNKELKIGNTAGSPDLKLTHDTNNSIITNATGELLINSSIINLRDTSNNSRFRIDSGGTGTFSGDVSIADKIIHTGDTDTAIRFPGANEISFETAGTERVKFHNYGSNNWIELRNGQNLSLADNGSNSRFILIGDGDASSTGAMFLQAGGGSTGFGGGLKLFSHANSTNPGGVYIGKSLNSSGFIQFGNGGTTPTTEFGRFDSSGRLLMGTTTEGHSSADDLTIATSGNTGITLRSGTSSAGNIYFSDATSGTAEYAGFISYSHSTNAMSFGTNGSNTERVQITSTGLVGINETNPVFALDIKRAATDIIRMNNSGETTHGNADAKIVAGGTYYQNMDFHAYLYKIQTYNGSSLGERLRITKDGQVLIGTTSSLSFNGVGQNHNLIVAGESGDTDITDNYNAALTISNKDGTANNTAGLHFAREDTDGDPHFNGASIVAQFLETMNTQQYPKADLAFLTSTANNNAPSQKMRLKADGEVLSTASFVSKTTAEYSANVNTSSGFTNQTMQIVLAEDVLDNHSVYVVNFSWNHQGSGQPYLTDGAFLFQPGATNPGSAGAMGPTFTPPQGSHTEQGVTKFFTFQYYSPTGGHVHGLKAAFNGGSLNDANGNGALQIKIFKIGAETTI